ncbi:MAG: hypothetical protein JWR37_4677 [Mycobacterium sp.]|jgi:hypothetical protein|nr:hypothetical protein [Mycobacterium sp.]
MGGNTEVDLVRLRDVANRVMNAANTIAELRFPGLDADDLRGSAVGGIAAPDLIAARLNDVVANMRGWAVAAHMSADALERSERHNAARFDRR